MQEKPLTPAEAKKKRIESIPNAVVRAVNSLLDDTTVRFGVTALREAILRELKAEAENYSPETMPDWCKFTDPTRFPSAWFDFEPIFMKAGWEVSYDRPGYNESGETTWTFSSK
jgi:hypothetical protein